MAAVSNPAFWMLIAAVLLVGLYVMVVAMFFVMDELTACTQFFLRKFRQFRRLVERIKQQWHLT
jgi:hypothetical protein